MPNVTVYGASGHTGRFIVAELLRRGWNPVLSGRGESRLREIADGHGGLEVRVAAADDPDALDRALTGSVAVVNAAGPFYFTNLPVASAALRARVPYLDVAAEVEAVDDVLRDLDGPARAAGVPVIPALAFYGGLGDLLASYAAGDWNRVDSVGIAYWMDGWAPTAGTRASGEVSSGRRDGRRVTYRDGAVTYTAEPGPAVETHDFPAPVGPVDVLPDVTMADRVTIGHRLGVARIDSAMSARALADLRDPDLPPPVPGEQRFLVDVTVRRGGETRRAHASGRDIYAITAPIVVEALARTVAGEVPGTGTFTAAEAFDASAFLAALPLSVVREG